MNASSRIPGYWRNETSSVLKAAVGRYLADQDLSDGDIAALRAYLRQWDAGDFIGPDITDLRARVDFLTTRQDIARWLHDATNAGIDPL